jgi:hypothetical protein
MVAAASLEAASREREADLLRACEHHFAFEPGEARWTIFAPGWLFALYQDIVFDLHDSIVAYAPSIASPLTSIEVVSHVNEPVAVGHLDGLWGPLDEDQHRRS